MPAKANTFSTVIERVAIPRLKEGHEPGCDGFCVCYIDGDACWTWNGYATDKAPMVKWQGKRTTVVRVLSEGMLGGNPRSTRRTCGNSFCVNPMHTTSLDYVETALPYMDKEEAEEVFADEAFHTIEYPLVFDDYGDEESLEATRWLEEHEGCNPS